MTTWKEAAAQLGTSSLVDSLKALEGTMKKRDYKRLVSTTAAQLLELHPGLGAKKARRWVRRATGTKPAKRPVEQPVQEEHLEAATTDTDRPIGQDDDGDPHLVGADGRGRESDALA